MKRTKVGIAGNGNIDTVREQDKDIVGYWTYESRVFDETLKFFKRVFIKQDEKILFKDGCLKK